MAPFVDKRDRCLKAVSAYRSLSPGQVCSARIQPTTHRLSHWIFRALLLAVAGAEPKDAAKLDGVNLLPYLKGKEKQPPHDALFWRQNRGDIWALRSANQKLLVDRREEGQPQLYDLGTDIGETADLAGPNSAQLAKSLRDKFLKWDSQNNPPFFLDYRSYWKHMDDVHKSTID